MPLPCGEGNWNVGRGCTAGCLPPQPPAPARRPNRASTERLFASPPISPPPHALLAPLQLPFGRAAAELSADLVVPSFPLPASNREQAPHFQATAPRCYASGAGRV